MYDRRDVWTLQASPPWDPVTLGYAQAIQLMQQRAPDDPTSWIFQAGIHGSYSTPPPDAEWNQCQHRHWYFLPWHRMYVYYFERIVRAAVIETGGPSDWALPYWNYDRPFPSNTLPLPFREPSLPDGSDNPLYLPPPKRAAAYMRGAQLDPLLTSSSVAMDPNHTQYSLPQGFPLGSSFGGAQTAQAHFGVRANTGQLEQQPHNVIHGALGGGSSGQCAGGLMSDANCAAADPIFWLHHANIDRLWVQWVNLGGGRSDPTETEWLDTDPPFPFYDENGDEVECVCREVVDVARLGYQYV